MGSRRAPAGSRAPTVTLRRKAVRVDHLLRRRYGSPRHLPSRDPIATLVRTILSQNTSDRNSDLAFRRLRARFASWTALRDAPPPAVIEAIRPGGLGALKAPRLQGALRQITAARGRVSLDFLRRWSTDRAAAWLRALRGVGPKTVAIVLLFAFGKRVFPVDTHVHRVCTRLGLIPPGMGADAAHPWMSALVPPRRHAPFHLLLVQHGRETCKAGRPRCEVCPLRGLCTYYARVRRV